MLGWRIAQRRILLLRTADASIDSNLIVAVDTKGSGCVTEGAGDSPVLDKVVSAAGTDLQADSSLLWWIELRLRRTILGWRV